MKPYKCPYCGKELHVQITRKQACPFCGRDIYVRSGKLVTEDESITIDWVEKLNLVLRINRKEFEKVRADLSTKFGLQAPARDVAWTILNKSQKNAQIYDLMAELLAEEDKDPIDMLVESAKEQNRIDKRFKRITSKDEKYLSNVKPIFLSQTILSYVNRLSARGDYEKADQLLFMAIPSPAVLDGIRKNASRKANIAKKQENWQKVIELLEGYNKYARECRNYCIKTANQEPPSHTKIDQELLIKAKKEISSRQ